MAAAASRLGPILIGEDPTRIEYIWHKLYASFNSLGSLGFVSALISGVDIALWDIRGKALGLPIYELLGGKFHERLILYSNGWFDGCETPEEYAQAAKRDRRRRATRRIKLDPFKRGAAYLAGYAANYPPDQDYDAVEIIAAVREAVGPGIEIFIDAHGRFNVPTAVRLANRLRAVPHRLVRGAGPARELGRAAPVPRPDGRAGLRRRAALHPLAVPPGPGAEARGLHHAGHHPNGRHLRDEEDRHDGRGVLRADLAARRDRPDHADRRRPDDDVHVELLPPGDRLLGA